MHSRTRLSIGPAWLGPPLLAAILICQTTFAAVRYTLTDLGTIGNGGSYATDINNSGQVCGDIITDQPSPAAALHSAFIYSNGFMQDIGSLGAGDTWARAINNSGDVVGYSLRPPGSLRRAYVYDGSMRDLGAGNNSYAAGINDAGIVVGSAVGGSFIYSSQQVQIVNITSAQDINSTGQIAVGSAGGTGAYLYDNGVLTQLVSSAYSSALRINASGDVVGWYELDSAYRELFHAFVYDGSFHDLGTLQGDTTSWAADINAKGQIVGWSSSGSGNPNVPQAYQRAFLYDDGEMQDLTSLLDRSGDGWTLKYLPSASQWAGGNGVPNPNRFIAINDWGQIACTAMNASGQTHAVLLTPTPEPSYTALMLAAFAVARRRRCAMRHRRRKGM